MDNNKIKFGLSNVHYAKITGWSDDGSPEYDVPAPITGAVSLSIDANGGSENVYADNGVYYVINNNFGYEGELEVALVTTDFAKDILGETLDDNDVLIERNDAESAQFALLFEFEGDKNKIRHVLYCCSVGRPATESSTMEDSTEVKTEILPLKAMALPNGLVKCKSCEFTEESVYSEWFGLVYGLSYTKTDENDYIYTITEDNANVIRYIGKIENPKIPETLGGAVVKTLSAVSFCHSTITAVYIPEGVEEIL